MAEDVEGERLIQSAGDQFSPLPSALWHAGAIGQVGPDPRVKTLSRSLMALDRT
jgi:hypothetical protein